MREPSTRGSEALGYISLEQARALAIQHARDNTEFHGHRYARANLVWEVASQEEEKDFYHIRLFFRPAGRSRGEPGVVQLLIDKAGIIQLNQILDEPSGLGQRSRLGPQWLLPSAGGVVIVVVALIALAVSRNMGDAGDQVLSPAVSPFPTARPEPTATLQPEAKVGPAATLVPAATAVPVAAPVLTATPQHATPPRPFGLLNVGLLNLGPYAGHPGMAANPQIHINSSFGITESLLMHNTTDGAVEPMLADWSISSDSQRWTFKLREGVRFHKGFGTMTSSDVVYSFKQVVENDRHPRAGTLRDVFFEQNGSIEIVDDLTVILDTGNPFPDVGMFTLLASPRPSVVWIVSRQQSEALGVEPANIETAATGPWEISESRPNEFWRLGAVEDHWRKTPEFAEMILWDIPEEAARVAAFQAGLLDTFNLSPDYLPEIASVADVELMRLPNAGQAGLNLYGQTYVGIGTPGQQPGYDPNLPWVSSNPSIYSLAWDRARKVRQALSIAIDRELIADTMLQGFGRPLAMRDWAGREQSLPPGMEWAYDPGRAKGLLAEAAYPNGFSITLSPALRGAPGEVAACEAVAEMWLQIGVEVDFQVIPYGTLRTSLMDRTYQGATCHSIPNRLAPVLTLSTYLTESRFNFGVEHPLLEDLLPKAFRAISRQEREAYELEAVRFFYAHALAGIGLYSYDSVWPLGPRLGPWLDRIRRGDIRLINSLEWAPHRR